MSDLSDTIDISTTERKEMPDYQVIVYGYITADDLKEAEELYEAGEWFPDYHVLEDENGQQFDQNDIEELANAASGSN